MHMKKFGIVMAGGGGTRFWPASTKEVPKQFLDLTGEGALINQAIDRLTDCINGEDIYVVTNISQAEKMESVTNKRLAPGHILAEPAARNTSACIGYAAIEIVKKYGDGIMGIVPADPAIKDRKGFSDVLRKAFIAAEETDRLVTIGIQPEFAATGYGYIRYGNNWDSDCFEVEEFVEKPDLETAENYCRSGSYLWNSGMFFFKASVILNEFEKLLPDIYGHLMTIKDALGTHQEQEVLNRIYPLIPKVSIDYGIMERSAGVLVLKGDFGWMDVGSWDALSSVYPIDENGCVLHGNNVVLESRDCVVYSQGKLIALLGVKDLIVAESGNSILVCSKEKAQDVKQIVDLLTNQGRNEYL